MASPHTSVSSQRRENNSGVQASVKGSLFLSQGILRVKVLEVSEPNDLTPNRRQSVLGRLRRPPQLYCYAKFGIVTPEDILVGNVETSPAFSCASNCSSLVLATGREASVFPNVLSGNMLRVIVVLTPGTTEEASLAYAADSDLGGSRQLDTAMPSSAQGDEYGHITVPLSNLESGRSIVQWYQLHRAPSKESKWLPFSTSYQGETGSAWTTGSVAAMARTSVKLEILFEATVVSAEKPMKNAPRQPSLPPVQDLSRHHSHDRSRTHSDPMQLAQKGDALDSEDADDVILEYERALAKSLQRSGDSDEDIVDDLFEKSELPNTVDTTFDGAMGFEAMRILHSNQGDSNSEESDSDRSQRLVSHDSSIGRGMADFASYKNVYISSEEEEESRESSPRHPDAVAAAKRRSLTPKEQLQAENKQTEAVMSDDQHQVPAGLVDYVILLGPAPQVKRAARPESPSLTAAVSSSVPSVNSTHVASATPQSTPHSMTTIAGGILSSVRTGIASRFRRDSQKPSPGHTANRNGSISGGSGHGTGDGMTTDNRAWQASGSAHGSSTHSGDRKRATTVVASNQAFGTGNAQLMGDPVAVWDRFPRSDHVDLPLVEQLGHFACPEGCLRISAVHRPLPQISSFVLSAGGLEEQRGVTLTFFTLSALPAERDAATVVPDNRYSSTTAEAKLWEDIAPTSDNASAMPKKQWIGLTLCLLLRFPFVQQLQQLLLHCYHTQLLRVLRQHELLSATPSVQPITPVGPAARSKLPLTVHTSFSTMQPFH